MILEVIPLSVFLLQVPFAAAGVAVDAVDCAAVASDPAFAIAVAAAAPSAAASAAVATAAAALLLPLLLLLLLLLLLILLLLLLLLQSELSDPYAYASE